MAEARILDQGYRRYTGEREGVGHAVRSVISYTLRRVLGLRRPARSKVLPFMSIAFAYLPAIVFIGIIALAGRFGGSTSRSQITNQFVPRYPDYYGFIVSAVVLFVAFVAPEALCPDRRSRSLSLYLASPLNRVTYLLAKIASVGIILAFVTIGPVVLLLVGRIFQGTGPDGILGVASVLLRILGAGLSLTVLFTAVSVGLSSLTDRRAFAAAGMLLLLVGSSVLAGTVVFALKGPRAFLLLSLTRAPFQLARHFFTTPNVVPVPGSAGGSPPNPELVDLPTLQLIGGFAAWTTAGFVIAAWRYLRLQVTR